MSRSGVDTRQAILLAANRVVLKQGVEHLTLKAIAQEARISKGGLLHHFPSKEALIMGMIQLYLERFTHDFTTAAGQEGSDGPGCWTRAYLEATFQDNQQSPRMNAGLLAAIATNPDLLLPVQKGFADWVELLGNDGLDPVKATIARLVADGLWLVELFGLAPPDEEMKDRVQQEMQTILQMDPNTQKRTRSA